MPDADGKPERRAGEAQPVFRKVIDDVAMVEAFAVPKPQGTPLQALPRPAPPQPERPWWRRWLS